MEYWSRGWEAPVLCHSKKPSRHLCLSYSSFQSSSRLLPHFPAWLRLRPAYPDISPLLRLFLSIKNYFPAPLGCLFKNREELPEQSCFTSLEITKPETFSPSRWFKFTEVNNHFCSLWEWNVGETNRSYRLFQLEQRREHYLELHHAQL